MTCASPDRLGSARRSVTHAAARTAKRPLLRPSSAWLATIERRARERRYQGQPRRHDRPPGDQKRLAAEAVGQSSRGLHNQHPGHHAHRECIRQHPLGRVQVPLEVEAEIDATRGVGRVVEDHRRRERPEAGVFREQTAAAPPWLRAIALALGRRFAPARLADQKRSRDRQALDSEQGEQDRLDATLSLGDPSAQQRHQDDADGLPEPERTEGGPDLARGGEGRRLGAGKALDHGAADPILRE